MLQNTKIPFIDISKVNCWIAYLMPFDSEERGSEKVKQFQLSCIQQKIFGMGWVPEGHFECDRCCTSSIENYLKAYKSSSYGSDEPSKPLLQYSRIAKGDYVVMRLRDGHYYVGRVEKETHYIHADEPPYNILSWGCTVEKWYEIADDGHVPAELRGRFSQQLHPTIQIVNSYRLCLLIMKLYDLEMCGHSDVPRLAITKYNFIRSLDYMELEDLVCVYIYERYKNYGYVLLPSSCKVNQQKYEYKFVSHNYRPIMFSVK